VLKSVEKIQVWLEIRHIIRYVHEYLSIFLMLINFVTSHVATQLPMGRIFVKFYNWGLVLKLSRKFKFS